jgi:hypothetical protein
MQKFKELFLKSKLLNEQEFNELSKYAVGDIKRDSNDRLIITFTFNDLEGASVVDIAIKNKHFISKHADLIIKYKEFTNFSKINSFLTLYTQKFNIISTIVTKKFLNDKFSIYESKLEIQYANQNEKDIISSKTSGLVSFLNEYGFNLSGINFIHVSNDEEVNKFKKENSKAEVIVKQENKFDDMARQN